MIEKLPSSLPLFWSAVLAFGILVYVLFDGFGQGLGILFVLNRDETHRQQTMGSIAPVWDGTETWLVLKDRGWAERLGLCLAAAAHGQADRFRCPDPDAGRRLRCRPALARTALAHGVSAAWKPRGVQTRRDWQPWLDGLGAVRHCVCDARQQFLALDRPLSPDCRAGRGANLLAEPPVLRYRLGGAASDHGLYRGCLLDLSRQGITGGERLPSAHGPFRDLPESPVSQACGSSAHLTGVNPKKFARDWKSLEQVALAD